MTGSQTRQKFLDYFAQRGHRVVRSSSLVPANDPTLLFTNAGMNQFKDVFLGQEKRDYNRAASSQKCVRAGGKHNDLDNVGYTRRHHTFFEMLGNFSFGDYFKRDAIAFAWELITKEYGLPKDRLYVTVFREDDDAEKLWQSVTGMPKTRIFRLDEKDNFWQMGDTGPCGPCSEIHYDFGLEAAEPGREHEEFPDDGGGRFVEIWNLVFMQFDRDSTGKLTPLPRPSIDTGMGLERIAAVMQGKLSNYDTDLIRPIIDQAGELFRKSYGEDERADVALRINADHARATAFLINDGVLPSNEGRGYVLRKIMRRAMRNARMIGVSEPYLYQLTGFVAEHMRDAYPEMMESVQRVARVVKDEEHRYATTFQVAEKFFHDEAKAAGGRRACAVLSRSSCTTLTGSRSTSRKRWRARAGLTIDRKVSRPRWRSSALALGRVGRARRNRRSIRFIRRCRRRSSWGARRWNRRRPCSRCRKGRSRSIGRRFMPKRADRWAIRVCWFRRRRARLLAVVESAYAPAARKNRSQGEGPCADQRRRSSDRARRSAVAALDHAQSHGHASAARGVAHGARDSM